MNSQSTSTPCVFITGAAAGLGLALCCEYILKGYKVFATDIQEIDFDIFKDRLISYDKRLATLSSLQDLISYYQADVADSIKLQSIAALIHKQVPFIDIVIANAGIGGTNPADLFDANLDDLFFKVNYEGTRNTFLAFLPQMKKEKRGKLVCISSLAAFRGLPYASSYCASKAAQKALCESWRIDLAPLGIHVIQIHPGFLKTAMTNHKNFKMPFMVNLKSAATVTIKAINQNQRVFRFPFIMAIASILNNLIPSCIFDRVIPFLSAAQKDHPHIFGKKS